MKCERIFAVLIVIAISTNLSAAPVTFEGVDPGAGPANPRPNSNAAAANFDAAAGSLGAVNLINFESAPLGNFAVLNIAPGVTAALSGTDADGGIRTQATFFSGTTPETLGYNTTSGGARFLGVVPTGNGIDARLALNFSPAIQAFGTYLTGLGTASGNLFVVFNDGSNQSISVAGSASGGAKFFGFTDPGASIVQVALELRNVSGSRDIFAVDDLRFVPIPEPSTIALAMCLTIAGLARIRRRS